MRCPPPTTARPPHRPRSPSVVRPAHVRLAACVLAAALAAGCDAPATAPVARPVDRRSDELVLNVHEAFVTMDGSNACNGDVLSGTAKLHVVRTVTRDRAGGLHVTRRVQLANVQFTGAPSGASYVGHYESSDVYNVRPSQPGPPGTETFDIQSTLIGRGATANALLRSRFHVTVTPGGGAATVRVDPVTVECR